MSVEPEAVGAGLVEQLTSEPVPSDREIIEATLGMVVALDARMTRVEALALDAVEEIKPLIEKVQGSPVLRMLGVK